jgi:D-alanine transaminase
VIAGIDPHAICFLSADGDADRWTPLAQARVPVLDRGFIFGDGVYEVVPVYEGRAFRLVHHLQRFARSMREVGIANPLDDAAWTVLVAELFHANAALGPNQLVYLQVTRGIAKRDHAFPPEARPTIFGMTSPWSAPRAAQLNDGVAVVTMDDQRWQRCDIKSISLIGNVLARQYAVEQGAAETILLRGDQVTEGAAANVWVVHDGELRTPPTDPTMLEGIRLALIAELALAEGIRCVRGSITRDALQNADEVLLSSAGREVLPVTRVDGWPVGDGKPGPVFQRLYTAYQRAKADPAHSSLLQASGLALG